MRNRKLRWLGLSSAVLGHMVAYSQRLEAITDYSTTTEFTTYPSSIEFDRGDSVLYMGFSPCVINDAFVPGLARWDGVAWEAVPNALDSLQCTTLWVRSLAFHDGSLFVSGSLGSLGGLGPDGARLVRYALDGWHVCGSPSSWPKLTKTNDELWALGGFDSIGTNGANNIARYENGDWWPFGSSLANNEVRSAAYHDGIFFVAGNFTQSPVDPDQDILFWNGGVWQQVGEGLGASGFDWVNAMVEFQGRLFVGGSLWIADGNPGQHLVVWDGQQWSDFFQDRLLCRNQVNDLQVIDGKLYMAGVFQFSGDAHYYNLLQYDGESLCAVGKDLTASAGLYATQVRGNSHEIYFSNAHIEYAGDTVNYMAKWVLSVGPDTCISAPLSLLERTLTHAHLFLHGNPQHAVLHFSMVASTSLPRGSHAALVGLDGRLVKNMPLAQYAEGRYAMDVAAVPAGLYVLVVQRPGLPQLSRRVALE